MTSGSDRPSVAIVEDDASLLGALAFALQEEGFTIRQAAGRREFFDHPIAADCFVVDFRLGDADGLTLISELRAAGFMSPAILITTHPDERCRRRAAGLGVEIVEKPLIGTELAQHIEAAIARG